MNENIESKKYALIIGSNQYDGKPMWSDLKNAEYDATSMKEILEVKYKFETQLLLSPTKNEVLKTIFSYHKRLNRNDRFLIFIAGHGDYDKAMYNDGFLVFKDSKPSDEDFARSTYLAYNQLNGILNSLPSQHVGIILDVCFGGTFNSKVNSYRSANATYNAKSTDAYVRQKLSKKSRLFLTSGALEPVPDGYKGKHSPFCYLLLDALENGNDKGYPITLSWMHQQAQLNITESMYGFFGDNQPGSEFIIGGIKSADNSSLVNKLLEEKELKEKAERREREAKSLLLVQEAIQANQDHKSSTAFKKIIQAYQYDSTNYSAKELYYKMMLENDPIYLDEVLSTDPLPLEELEIIETTPLDIKLDWIINVNYEKRIIIAQQQTKLLTVDFNGFILNTYQTKLEADQLIYGGYFFDEKFYLPINGELIIFDYNLKKLGHYKEPENLSLYDLSEDETTTIFFNSITNKYEYYHKNKLVKEIIKQDDESAVESIYLDTDKNLNIRLYYLGVYKDETYNTTGKKISRKNIKNNRRKYYNNGYSSVMDTETEKVVFSYMESENFQFNYDSITDDVFHFEYENETQFLKSKVRFKTKGGIIYDSFNKNKISVNNDSPFPVDYLVLNDSTIIIAHKNDICIKSTKDQKALLRKRTQDFVKMVKNPTDNTFYLLTGDLLFHYNTMGEQIEVLKLSEKAIDMEVSPKGETIVIFYQSFWLSTLNKNFEFISTFIHTDPVWFNRSYESRVRRKIKFLNEEQFLVFDIEHSSYTYANILYNIRLFNREGEVLTTYDESVLHEGSSIFNNMINVEDGNMIFSTFIDNDSVNYVIEMDKEGNIIHSFGKWNLKKNDSYIHANVHKLDSSCFVIVNNKATTFFQKDNNEWIKVDSIKLIADNSYDTTYTVLHPSELSIIPEFDFEYPFLPCYVDDRTYGNQYSYYNLRKSSFDSENKQIEFIKYDGSNNFRSINETLSISNNEGAREYDILNTQKLDSDYEFKLFDDFKIKKFDYVGDNIYTLSNKVKKTFKYTPDRASSFIYIPNIIYNQNIINDSLIVGKHFSIGDFIYNLNSKDSLKDISINSNCRVESNICLSYETTYGDTVTSITTIINLLNNRKKVLNNEYKYPNFNSLNNDYFFVYEKDSILDVYSSDQLNKLFSYSINDSIFHKIKEHHENNNYYTEPSWVGSSNSKFIYSIDGNYYFRYYDVLFEIDFNNKDLSPVEKELKITLNNNYLVEEKDKSTIRLYRLQNRKVPSFMKSISDWNYYMTDTTLSEIKLPLNSKEDFIKSMYSDENYFLVKNAENTFFFDIAQNKFSVKFLNKFKSIDKIKYIKEKNIFIGYKDNNLYFFDHKGDETMTLSLNNKVAILDIYNDKLKFVCGGRSENGSNIYLNGNYNIFEIPLFDVWLKDIDKVIRN
ncbi:caspase family protein [Flammeovirga aprica]|uniref:Caspase family protein n=1 Tax=Flammeovirga aprica JL-4 TaxID=694437 RepID=A0A7X9P3G1_9BACT|nr:caspase family protein [Flammeovirga aprica]NME67934.1 caspase family protein [Flammeovirga aprica JL-4]